MDVERIHRELARKDNRRLFEQRLEQANTLLAGTFLFSAVANYLLAKAIVRSERAARRPSTRSSDA